MTDLFSYLTELDDSSDKKMPPVNLWNPDRSGEIDIVINSDGTWLHEGTLIKRARLVRLFSKILKREGGDHYLVTPYEKLRITVEDAPFVAPLMRVEGIGENQMLFFTTNVGDVVLAGGEFPIIINADGAMQADFPYIDVRDGLLARIGRSIYYDLVALCDERLTGSGMTYNVVSNGTRFSLGIVNNDE